MAAQRQDFFSLWVVVWGGGDLRAVFVNEQFLRPVACLVPVCFTHIIKSTPPPFIPWPNFSFEASNPIARVLGGHILSITFRTGRLYFSAHITHMILLNKRCEKNPAASALSTNLVYRFMSWLCLEKETIKHTSYC
jgi:hypothetical protein